MTLQIITEKETFEKGPEENILSPGSLASPQDIAILSKLSPLQLLYSTGYLKTGPNNNNRLKIKEAMDNLDNNETIIIKIPNMGNFKKREILSGGFMKIM